MKPSYKLSAPKGYMGDPKRGAALGRVGFDTPAQALESAKTCAAGMKLAVDYFAEFIDADKVPDHLRDARHLIELYDMRKGEYAADLARVAALEEAAKADTKVYLHRIAVSNDGYDVNGTYWGCGGDRLYWAASEDGIDMTFRAKDRAAAKVIVLESNPTKRFFR